MNRVKDLSGQRFGRLVVLHRDESAPAGRSKWVCRCDCGNTVSVWRNHLTGIRGTASCGCARIGVNSKNLSGQRFGRLTAIEPTAKKSGNTYVWKCQCDCGRTCYASAARLQSGDTKSCGCLQSDSRSQAIKAAREVSDRFFIDGTYVPSLSPDCIQANNTSGKRGVSWDSSVNRWKAYIYFKRHRYYLGSSRDFEVAVQYRIAAEKQIHGDFLEWYADAYPNEWKKIQSRKKK